MPQFLSLVFHLLDTVLVLCAHPHKLSLLQTSSLLLLGSRDVGIGDTS